MFSLRTSLVQSFRCRTQIIRSLCINKDDPNVENNLLKTFKIEKLDEASTLDADDLAPHQESFKDSAYAGEEAELLRMNRSHSNNQNLIIDRGIDDSKNSVIIFPGQGSQFVGMCKKIQDVPIVKDLFERASTLTDMNLLKLCLEGPSEVLSKTRYCQPAIVVASLAAVEMLYMENPKAIEDCIATAGFSLGEITALIFSGALSFDEGIQLVKARGEAMQLCSDLEPSGLMTVFYKDKAKLNMGIQAAIKFVAEKYNVEQPICQTSCVLYQGARVIGGNNEVLDFIEENQKDFTIRKVKRVPASGAFHTALMRPAYPVLKEALKNMTVSKPRVPVYSNLNGFVFTKPKDIISVLPQQLTNINKWETTVHKMLRYERFEFMPNIYSCGPGTSLVGMMKFLDNRYFRKSKAINV